MSEARQRAEGDVADASGAARDDPALGALVQWIDDPELITRAIAEARLSGLPPEVWLYYTGAYPARLVGAPVRGDPARLVPPSRSASEARRRIARAISGLARGKPWLSARCGVETWQLLLAVGVLGVALGFVGYASDVGRSLAAAILTMPFLLIGAWRAAALAAVIGDPRLAQPSDEWRPDWPEPAELPSYTVLVPLYREQHVLPGLVGALERLDYPRDRLEILLVLEESDADTRQAAEALATAATYRIVVVPEAGPRTKPKALNFALSEARGTYLVVYDAEDLPDPDQLRRAAAAFAAAEPGLGCFQARLSIDRSSRGWLGRQFANEYAALFGGLLPILTRWRLPVPLGGTSNHLPRHVVEAIGGWDSYNVTEDADLGVRLARFGWRVEMLDSETVEEAPGNLGDWLRQRTRWMKGYLQTYLVHMRRPGRLLEDIGWRSFVAIQCTIGGVVLSALVQPVFYALVLLDALTGQLLARPETTIDLVLTALAAVALVAGYGSAMLLSLIVSYRREGRVRWLAVLTLPIYWLLISVAAYRAMWQLARRPFVWEKTPHAARPAEPREAGPA